MEHLAQSTILDSSTVTASEVIICRISILQISFPVFFFQKKEKKVENVEIYHEEIVCHLEKIWLDNME